MDLPPARCGERPSSVSAQPLSSFHHDATVFQTLPGNQLQNNKSFFFQGRAALALKEQFTQNWEVRSKKELQSST